VEQREVLQVVGPDGRLGRLRLLTLATVGTSSGVISVLRIEVSTSSARSPNRSEAITQRIRCCISVLGTPPLTL
jgi:hypothetical protein